MPNKLHLVQRAVCSLHSEYYEKNRYLALIVSTGGIRWILWFSICYAAATGACKEISALTLTEENYTS